MPHLLWPFFNNNWPLLNALFGAATRAMLCWARKQGVEVGIFCALHTYGRQLNQHPHIHLSVTRGGLDVKHGVWRSLFFKKQPVEEIWRGAVIRLLRHTVRTPLEGPLREEDPRRLAERQIPGSLPEAAAGVGGEAQALRRRRRSAPLLRPPYAAAPAADADAGRDDRALYQSRAGQAF
nr:transposase [uncultured bacterium]